MTRTTAGCARDAGPEEALRRRSGSSRGKPGPSLEDSLRSGVPPIRRAHRRIVAALALITFAAFTLATTAPPKAPADALGTLHSALTRVESGASLNLRSLGSTGAMPQRYVNLSWDLVSEFDEEISILGSPRVIEAVADGRDLLTTALHRVNPEHSRPTYFTGPRRQGEPVVLSAGVTFEHAGDMPARLDRVTIEVDVAAKGDTLTFDLPPVAAAEFTPLCPGIEARVLRVGTSDAKRGADPYAVVEYRLAGFTQAEAPASAPPTEDAPRASRSRPVRFERADPAAAFRAPVVASINALDDLDRRLGRLGLHLETPTTTGRFGMVVLFLPQQSEPVAIRLEVNPAAEVRRLRLRAIDVGTGG